MNIILNAGREKSLLRRHPWIFSGGIRHADDNIASGSTVDLLSSDKQFLARASYSPHSQIRARVWTFNDEPVDKEFFRRRFAFFERGEDDFFLVGKDAARVGGRFRAVQFGEKRLEIVEDVVRAGDEFCALLDEAVRSRGARAVDRAGDGVHLPQIGRASCRERV